MEVYALGYGGWLSRPWMGYTSIYVKTDVSLLLDAGEGAYARLVQCGLPFPDAIFVSHRHGDHLLGVPTFLLVARHTGRRLKLVGPREALEAVRALASITAIEGSLAHADLVEAGGTVELGETRLRFARALHPVETLAVRVEYGGQCIAYSADTAPSEEVAELARGCRLLIHEASGNPGQEEAAHAVGHSTTADAVEVARRAGVGALAPVHFGLEAPAVPPGVPLVLPTPCGRLL